ncbi:unnamed protein product [Clonostachys solani]|uniref:Uncharacterized protein n=1 Tax=Clonostachys solani TaxID=160281 RepID=A0A9N9VWD5_9HYPO|nr:unnamed protein product [Clonostachys solani]
MAARQCLPARACLCQRLAPQRPRSQVHRNLQTRWSKSGAVERLRNFASIAGASDIDLLRPSHVAPAPFGDPQLYIAPRSPLSRLLAAVRAKDAAAISKEFVAWTDVLGDKYARDHELAVKQFDILPSPTLSEIIRGIDPARYPEGDAANGLLITQGQTEVTDVGKLMDDLGVRAHHRRLFQGIVTIIYLRQRSEHCPLLVADFEVFLRIAGITADHHLASALLTFSSDQGLRQSRTGRTWIEYLRARFMTEPSNYQFDRNRVVVDPLNLVTANESRDLPEESNETKIAMTARLSAMESLRFSENATKRQPWNRNRYDPRQDSRRLVRHQGATNFRSFWNHWVRLRLSVHDFAEVLPTAIEAFSRSNSSYSILQEILKPFYGIEFDQETQTITGGIDIQKDSSLYPSDRLLFALVEAFGAMSEISVGMRVIDFISRRYEIAISAKTWSNLLNWTYVCASKKLRVSRRLLGEETTTYVSTGDVRHIWEVMTSAPYNITPSFEDLDTYIRTLIITRDMRGAVDLIRDTAMPFYEAVVKEYEAAIFDEVLFNDAHRERPTTRASRTLSSVLTASSFAFQRRTRAEVRKDFVFNRIALWFKDILSKVSDSQHHRKSTFTSVDIPDLIRDYPEFFATGIRYRTATGELSLKGTGTTPRYEKKHTGRQVLQQKKGASQVFTFKTDKNGQKRKIRDLETGKFVENPDFKWPTNRKMEIRENLRIPFERLGTARIPPAEGSRATYANAWWKRLEQEMSM